ncbi:MAG: DUF350 domain-containing protein [Candidatus Micrarchaeota archaeon]|nr:DUF350 domain-containing protein [Candidatus Micrarchaeota archaeon]MCX8154311.1 DUF350 domain-containing protein [Candidatus Micrarchaeota archaeon]
MELYLMLMKILINLMLGVITLFLSVKIFDLLTKEIDEIDEIKRRNVSVGILLGGIILSISIMIADVFRENVIPGNLEEFVKVIIMDIFRYTLSVIIGVAVIFISYNMFKILNSKRFNIVVELKNGNVAVAMLLAVFFVALMIMISSALKTLFIVLFMYPIRVI